MIFSPKYSEVISNELNVSAIRAYKVKVENACWYTRILLKDTTKPKAEQNVGDSLQSSFDSASILALGT